MHILNVNDFYSSDIKNLKSAYFAFLPDEITHAINLSKPKIIFVSPTNYQKYSEILEENSFLKKLILYDDNETVLLYSNSHILFSDLWNTNALDYEDFECEPQDMKERVAVILCSSGTTGLPKGVQLTQFNYLVACAQFR